MATARLIAHIATRCETDDYTASGHDGICDDVTAAIESDRAESAKALEVALQLRDYAAREATEATRRLTESAAAVERYRMALEEIAKLDAHKRGCVANAKGFLLCSDFCPVGAAKRALSSAQVAPGPRDEGTP